MVSTDPGHLRVLHLCAISGITATPALLAAGGSLRDATSAGPERSTAASFLLARCYRPPATKSGSGGWAAAMGYIFPSMMWLMSHPIVHCAWDNDEHNYRGDNDTTEPWEAQNTQLLL